VEAVVVQPDGKLAGGRFSNFNGTSYCRLARLNPDGSLEQGFLAGVGTDKMFMHCLRIFFDLIVNNCWWNFFALYRNVPLK
jgi:hypothetical protein